MKIRQQFRVVLISSSEPYAVMRLVSRIDEEVPEAKVCGILHERPRPPKNLWRRMTSFMRKLADIGFLAYVVEKIAGILAKPFCWLWAMAIHVVHASRGGSTSTTFGLNELSAFCGARDCGLLVTRDVHASESLEFVRVLAADLGVVYGSRILKPALFEIPRHGSINIHQRKVPDFRGGGPIGLWELLDGQSQIGVTVHRVTEQVDAGAIINATTFPIEPYDTLGSLSLKAHVVGNDLLVRSVADFVHGDVHETMQPPAGRTFRNPQPQVLRRYERQIAARRPRFQPTLSRPSWKLLARTLMGLPLVCARNWFRRARGNFPIMVLYHHLVSDRPHRMGIPTEVFFRHVQFLQKHYRIVSLQEAVKMLHAGRVEAPTVVLTFDDGYRDNYLNLRAIAEATGTPATLFVCTEKIETQSEFQHDLKEGRTGFLPLRWDQVSVLEREGFEIGSHTRSHFDCGATDSALLAQEITGSKTELKKRLGHDVSLFAFPWGLAANMSCEAQELARNSYPCVCSAYGGENLGSRKWDGHIQRCPHPDTIWELELTLQSILTFEQPPLGQRFIRKPLITSNEPSAFAPVPAQARLPAASPAGT